MVLHAVAVYTVEARGYCDMSAQQMSDRLKGAYSAESVQNALNCLTNGGILYTHRRGSMTADGKGRASQRVLVSVDNKVLIPVNWAPPEASLSWGVDTPDSGDDSQVDNHDSHVDTAEHSRCTDLPTHYELTHKTPTAAQALPSGAFHKDETQSLVMSNDTSATNWFIKADSKAVDRVCIAMLSRVKGLKIGNGRIRSIARDVVGTCLDATPKEWVDVVEMIHEQPLAGRTSRLVAIEKASHSLGLIFTQPEKEPTP